MDARSVGHELGVAYVVEGQVRRLGERTEVDVQVLDAAEATQIWSDRIGLDTMQPKSGLDVVVARLGDGIYTNIVRTAMRRFAGPPAADAGPYELAMYGRSEWYRDNNTLRGAREARSGLIALY